jgi:hypothetical protein
MQCNGCERELQDDEVRWGFDEPYCENCFDETFNCCSRCDSVIYRDETQYNSDGDPYCHDCFEEDYDDDAPDNPEVYDSDRELIINLSRGWLQGKVDTKRPIYINQNDILLKVIKDKVGLVQNPIYLFGLIDRDEYQILASNDLLQEVQEFTILNNLQVKVVSTPGCKRIGISQSLRKNKQSQIIDLIKTLSTTKVTV